MKNIANSLHSRIHQWIDAFGFRLNASQTNKKRSITTRHYFFETFNFFERLIADIRKRTNSFVLILMGKR